MQRKLQILDLGDSRDYAELIQAKLNEDGVVCEIRHVDNEKAFRTALDDTVFDLVLADFTLSSLDGQSALAIVQEKRPALPLIFVSHAVGEEKTIEALKSGAANYVLKNNLSRLAPSVRGALKEADERIARKQAEEELRESEERYRSLYNNSTDAVLLTAADGKIFAANPEACRMFGRTEEELRKVGRGGVVDRTDLRLPAALKERAGTGQFNGELTLVRKDGTKFPGEISTVLFTGQDGLTKTSMVIRDITERKRAQQERELTIEFLRLVNASTGTGDLIRTAATFFQQQSNCEAVGVRLKEGEDYPYFEARGFPKDFVLAENSLCARDSANCVIRDDAGNPVIECMCGNVICGRFDPAKSFFTKKGSFWTNNTTELLRRTTEADRQARTRNRCNGEGYESVALLPLRVGEERLGLLQLNDRRIGVFSSEVIGLWERLADQLAVALAKFRTEEALRESEERYHSLFMNMLNGYAYCKMVFEGAKPLDFIYLDVNAAFEKLTGLKNVINRKVSEVIPGIRETDPELFEIYGRVAMTGRPERFETYVEALHNWFSISIYSPGKEYFVAVFDVITERKQADESLRQSEARFSTVFKNSPIGIVISGVDDGKFYDVNDSFLNVYGYSREELVDRTSHDLGLWVDPEERAAMARALREQGRVKNLEAKFRKKSGEIGNLLISAERIALNGEERLLGMFTDITERKRMEEELRASIRMWDNTFDAMNDAIMISDKNGKVLRCNRALLYFLEKAPDQIVGKTHWDVVHPAEERGSDCAFTRMQKSRRRESMMLRLQMHWFTATIDPILDADGTLTGSVQILTDVTEHRQFEEQLRESESKFRSLAEQSLVGTYIIQNHMFQYANPRLAEMFGYGVEEIVGRKGPLDLIVPEDHHIVEDTMRQRLTGEKPFSQYEARGLKKSGDAIHVEIFGSRAYYQGKAAIVGIVLDVTEKNKLENQLRQAQKMEAIGQLTSGIAHDFNNILSAIIGYASLLQMKMKEDDPQKPYIDLILVGTDRAASLTRSLLTFSRKQLTNLQSVNINETVHKVETLLQHIIGEDIDLRTELAPGDLIVNADAGQIEQVLMNLATNARDAMPQGGILSIGTSVVGADELGIKEANRKKQPYVLISVTDTGTGMDDKTKEKIFEPFFTTKDLGRGTGLGLSMVYGIIKQHNGSIYCYSEPGMGTTFKIYLPLLAATVSVPAAARGPLEAEDRLQGTETILVAEDDESLRGLAKSTLESFGYTVITAVDGKDAVERFLENIDRIRLVLCDVIMPRMSGGEAGDAIRKKKPGMRILFMSGYPADIMHQKSMLEEGAEVILKPFSPLLMLRKVREALDEN